MILNKTCGIVNRFMGGHTVFFLDKSSKKKYN